MDMMCHPHTLQINFLRELQVYGNVCIMCCKVAYRGVYIYCIGASEI
jgi:hypothetical protein